MNAPSTTSVTRPPASHPESLTAGSRGRGPARVALAKRVPAAVVALEDGGPGRVSSNGGTGVERAPARELVQGAGGRLVLARPRPPRVELLLPLA